MFYYVRKSLLWIVPFYALLGFLTENFLNTHINKILSILSLVLFLVAVSTKKLNIPSYLWLLLSFALFHILSTLYFDLIPKDSNILIAILTDMNLFSFTIITLIHQISFSEKDLRVLRYNIFFIVVISLIVSILQSQIPAFFVKISDSDYFRDYIAEGRCPSIYSWININSIGITFPIFFLFLTEWFNQYSLTKKGFLLFTGTIISLLSKARYILLSYLFVTLRLFFFKKTSFKNTLLILIVAFISIFLLIEILDLLNYDVVDFIDNRILEKNNDLSSAKSRIRSYEVFMMVFPQNPYFGVGPKTGSDVVRMLGGLPVIHVGYLSYLYYYGIIGASLFFISLFLMIKRFLLLSFINRNYILILGFSSFLFANTTLVYFNLTEPGILLLFICCKYFESQNHSQNEKTLSNNNYTII